MRRQENKSQIHLPEGRGLGYFRDKQVVLGWGKVIGGRLKGEVIDALCMCIWVTCFCIFRMEALSMI